MPAPGKTIKHGFPIQNPATGGQADADATPTGRLLKDGVVTAVPVTVAKNSVDLGDYYVQFDIPTSYPPNATIQCEVKAVFNGVTSPWTPVYSEELDEPDIGPGAIEVDLIIEDDDGDPVPHCNCWITEDSAGSLVIAGTRKTDDVGAITFMLNAQAYYLWTVAPPGYAISTPKHISVASNGSVTLL